MIDARSSKRIRGRAAAAGLVAAFAAVTGACGSESAEPPKRGEDGTGGAGGGGIGGGGGVDLPPSNFDAGVACTTTPQSGCAPSDTCAVATLDGRTACQNAGTAPVGAYCVDDYDCGAGLVCLGGICYAQCQTPGDCGGVAQGCDQIYTAADQPITGFLACSIPCSPADPQNTAQEPSLAACASGYACYARDTPRGSTSCYPGGSVGLGGACDTDCGPGLVCLSDGTNATCQRFCVMGVTACNCLQFAEPYFIGLDDAIVEVGYCG
jgi:hypothetical protein